MGKRTIVLLFFHVVVASACNNNALDDMTLLLNQQMEQDYKARNVRQSPTCPMPDGSTRNYDKSGIWSGSSYPDCATFIRFYVFTNASTKATLFTRDNISAALTADVAAAMDNKKPLAVLFIGGDVETQWVTVEKLAKRLLEDHNIIIPHYDSSAGVDYLAAVGDSRLAADYLAIFVNNLIKQKVVSAANTIFIGHSVGAHVAGMAASQIPGLRAVIGLDPAGIFFDCNPGLGLSKSAAWYVRILHTTGNESVRYGSILDRGHADYYANYGSTAQPGCPPNIAPPMSPDVPPRSIACSHIRAFDIFYQAVLNSERCQFMDRLIGPFVTASRPVFTPQDIKALTNPSNRTIIKARFDIKTSSNPKDLCSDGSKVAGFKKGGAASKKNAIIAGSKRGGQLAVASRAAPRVKSMRGPLLVVQAPNRTRPAGLTPAVKKGGPMLVVQAPNRTRPAGLTPAVKKGGQPLVVQAPNGTRPAGLTPAVKKGGPPRMGAATAAIKRGA